MLFLIREPMCIYISVLPCVLYYFWFFDVLVIYHLSINILKSFYFTDLLTSVCRLELT